ncbi:hypothetical protein FO519_000558 [Halicephalobus sp. NKZ332]|nr:hypothetical protein FO519_000558 [Halicephalobus sp. NKZ332]
MTQLLVRDWEKDVVYLVQIPRAGAIPSLSPFCFKLETWLRMAGIKYHNVSNDFTHVSYKGQIPFIELNGRQIADSDHIIMELTKIFNVELDKNLTPLEWANSIAYHHLIEHGILWGNLYFKSINNNFMATPDGVINHFTGFKKFIFKSFILGQRRRSFAAKCKAQGIGLDTPAEVEATLKNQIKALSTFMGESKFLIKDVPTTVDAVCFSALCHFYYLPINKMIKNYIDEQENLVDYMRRMKEEFWSDWNEATTNLSLQTKPKNKNIQNGD